LGIAKAGNGRVALIFAEPGVSESRIAEALAERIADEPHTRLRYFCSPHHQDSALYPVIAQMERAVVFQHGDVDRAVACDDV
jgi:predicted ATPase